MKNLMQTFACNRFDDNTIKGEVSRGRDKKEDIAGISEKHKDSPAHTNRKKTDGKIGRNERREKVDGRSLLSN